MMFNNDFLLMPSKLRSDDGFSSYTMSIGVFSVPSNMSRRPLKPLAMNVHHNPRFFEVSRSHLLTPLIYQVLAAIASKWRDYSRLIQINAESLPA